jgi:Tfp pilus assembly protein PilE
MCNGQNSCFHYNENMEEPVSAMEIKEQIESADFNAGWSRYLALTTAIIAVLAAIASLQSGNYADRALLEKNNAVLLQSQASDQWNYYQAKGVKKNIAESFSLQLPSQKFKDQITQYAQEQQVIQKNAQDLEAQVKVSNEKTGRLFEKHHKVAIAVTFFQVAVALSAIGALLRRKTLWYISILSALLGIGLLLLGILM